MTVTVNTTPTMTLQDTIVCSPTTVDLTNTTYWTADVGTLAYWTDAGLTTPIGDPTSVGAGTYFISADNNGCINSGSVTVTVNTTPTLTLQDTTVCSPTTVDLTNTTIWTADLGTLAYWTDAGLTTSIGDPTVVGTGT